MYDTASDISSLISARICHDLASPLGAIANGLELLELSGLADSPEAALLGDSVASATARVEFFRIAYGSASAATLLSPSTAQRRIKDVFNERKINAVWNIPMDIARSEAKLLFLLLQSTETAMPFGGDITLSADGAGWIINATGREIRMISPLWEILTSGSNTVELQSSQVQFALASQHAGAINRTISFNATDTTLTVTVS